MSGHQLAQGVASLGRNGESMLVHMQPREVAGLQALAMQGGGTLTINPETGLPEAGWFGDILGAVAPIAIGSFLGPAGLALGGPGLSALQAGLVTGLGGFALSGGNLMKGLSAGLGGFGGANLGSNLTEFGASVTEAPLVDTVNPLGAGAETSQFMNPYAAETMGGMSGNLTNAVDTVGQSAMNTATAGAGGLGPGIADTTMASVSEATKPGFMGNLGSGVSKIMQPGGMGNYSDFLKAGYTDAAGNFVKGSAMMDAFTAASPLLAIQPEMPSVPEDTSYQMKYEGPYTAQDRSPRTPTQEELAQLAASGSPEYAYFGDSNPFPGFNKAPGYAQGGVTNMINAGVYGTQDGTAAQNTPAESYGIGRLNRLAQASADSSASQYEFANGGAVPYMPGAPSYGIAPTDLSAVAAIPTTPGGEAASSPRGLSSILGNAITDPMGRTDGNTQGGMGGKGGQQNGAQAYGNIFAGGFPGKGGSKAGSKGPQLTMEDYIKAATRTYDPNASIAAAMDPSGIERAHFTNINPAHPTGKAAGGGLRDGGFVVPADVVSHLGNGSTDAGLAALQKRHGARPIRGAGDGMSDSIKTTIEGRHPARVADGEAYIPPEQVKRSGGAKNLYAMMDKVRKARTGTKKQGKQINPNRFMTA